MIRLYIIALLLLAGYMVGLEAGPVVDMVNQRNQTLEMVIK